MRHKIRSSRRGPSELLCGGNVVSLHDQTMITSGLPVIPPGPMPSAEITSYKPLPGTNPVNFVARAAS